MLASGLRVLDMGWVWAGAVAGQILSDWGADVIKVESSKRIDPARQGRPIIGDKPDPEQNPMFHNVNRGKRSITLDITTPEGADIVKRLVATSDIVIENMTPHALKAAGLDYSVLSQVNDKLIMISHPLGGQDGPYREMRGYGPTAGSLVGLDYITGYEGDTEPTGFNHPVADSNAGAFAVIAVLSALHRRRQTGCGEYIDMSMWASLAAHQGFGILDQQFNARSGYLRGSDHQLYAPHGVYRCKDSESVDEWIAIAVATEDEWAALCEAMGQPEWCSRPEFGERFGRRANRHELDALITEWTQDWDKHELERYLQERGVAATACRNQQDSYLDASLREWGTYVDVEHPVLGVEPLYGNPVRSRSFAPSPLTRAPMLGEHTDEVLTEVLGMKPDEIERLREQGVLS